MLFETSEIRWFQPGHVPDDIAAWFAAAVPSAAPSPVRTDQYLRLPGDDSLGIKLREGRIEIKQRTAVVGETTLTQSHAGILERWCKWSYALDDVESPVAEAENTAAWIAVRKARSMASIGVGAATCNVELTQAWFDEDPWWGICLEAFGSSENNDAALVQAAKKVLKTGPVLKGEDSLSYAGVLAQLR